MAPKDILYLVVPCYNEEEMLPITFRELGAKLDALIAADKVSGESRMVFVNDGSKDRTWSLIGAEHAVNPRVLGVCLSRNYGHQSALLAGLAFSAEHSDMMISLDADLQDDIDAIDEMLDKYYDEGCEVVYGVREDRSSDSFFKRFTAQGFYRVTGALGGQVVYNHADYRLLSKRAVAALLEFDEYNLFLRGVVPMIGFKSGTVTYSRKEREAGTTKYPLAKMISFAVEGITSLSTTPLRMIAALGGVILLISIFMLLYSFVQQHLGNTIRGWSSTMVSIWALGGMQMLCIGVVGEYVGKIYLETKERPKYIVAEVIADEDRPKLK